MFFNFSVDDPVMIILVQDHPLMILDHHKILSLMDDNRSYYDNIIIF